MSATGALAATTVVLFAIDVGELPMSDAVSISSEMADAMRAAGHPTVVEDPTWDCPADCVGSLLVRHRAAAVVLLRIYGGPTRIQIDAERGAVTKTATIAYEPSAERSATLERLAIAVVEGVARPPPPAVVTQVDAVAPAESPDRTLAWVAVGASAVLLATGAATAFAAANRSDQIRQGVLLPTTEYDSLNSDRRAFATASGITTTAGVVTLGIATYFLFF